MIKMARCMDIKKKRIFFFFSSIKGSRWFLIFIHANLRGYKAERKKKASLLTLIYYVINMQETNEGESLKK